MRIAVIAHGLHVAGGRSVATNIIVALGRVRPSREYLFVVPDDEGYRELAFPARSQVVYYRRNLGAFGRMVFDLLQLPKVLRAFRPEVIFALGNFGVAHSRVPQAILFHKPQLVYPSSSSRRERLAKRFNNWLMGLQLQRSLNNNALVFCQTETICRRFRAMFGFYQGEIGLFPNAVSTRVNSDAEVESEPPAVCQGVGDKFVLFALTRYYPHKNLEVLIETFDQYREALSDICCLLTIEPGQHPGARDLLQEIDRRNLQDKIINVGNLDQRQLPQYYRHVGALILPTLLESFSATYIEAMALDCPILTSDLDFAREICADAAVYFDPNSPESVKNAIIRLRDDHELRQRLVNRGQHRLTQFETSWDKLTESAMTKIETFVRRMAKAAS
jgi:glycosyltransferase involved in cell wall biosynthesis